MKNNAYQFPFLNDVMPLHRLLGIWNKEAKIKDDEARQVANDG